MSEVELFSCDASAAPRRAASPTARTRLSSCTQRRANPKEAHSSTKPTIDVTE